MTFDAARKEKFERGAKEHGSPWDSVHINAREEMMAELTDLANYSDLLDDKSLADDIRKVAECFWNILKDDWPLSKSSTNETSES